MDAYVAQISPEVFALSAGNAEVSQLSLSAMGVPTATVLVAQVSVEVQAVAFTTLYVSQFCLAVLAPWRYQVPSLFPSLPGLTYSVFKRPKFFNGQSMAASGRKVAVAYSQYPLWEWDLTYNYLPDMQASGLTASDLKTLMGFFLSVGGNLSGFRFRDPDDFEVEGQAIGVGDASTTNFTLIRTYGIGGFSGNEPIGYVDITETLNVYLDAVLVDPADYSVNQTTPVNQLIVFDTPPSNGAVITVDMTFDYYVKFKDPTYDFEKFLDALWSLSKITLESQRGF